MSHINLLPDSYIAHERRTRMLRGIAVVAGTVLVVAVVWGSIAYGQLRALDLRMQSAETRLTDERNRANELDANRAALTDLKAVLAHRAQLEAPVPPPGVLALLTHLLPESIAVTKLSMELPPADLTDRAGSNRRTDGAQPPPAYVPTRVEMEGVALSDVELAKVVGTLASHKAFANVKLIRSRQVTTAGLTRFAFQITLEVPPALPPSAATGKPVARTAGKDSRGA